MSMAFIGLGSNLANPLRQIKTALEAIQQIVDTQLVKVSQFYCSEPWGVSEQPLFVNAVAELNTQLNPEELLKQLQFIENAQHRDRNGVRFGPRTIDLDILLFDQLQLNLPNLTVPHPYLTQREFVVYPLAEIAPNLQLPTGQSIDAIKSQLSSNNMQILTGETYDHSNLSRHI